MNLRVQPLAGGDHSPAARAASSSRPRRSRARAPPSCRRRRCARPRPRAARRRRRGRRRDLEPLLVQPCAARVLDAHRLERAGPDVQQRRARVATPRAASGGQQLGREVQPRRRRGDRAVHAREHGLVALAVLGACRRGGCRAAAARAPRASSSASSRGRPRAQRERVSPPSPRATVEQRAAPARAAARAPARSERPGRAMRPPRARRRSGRTSRSSTRPPVSGRRTNRRAGMHARLVERQHVALAQPAAPGRGSAESCSRAGARARPPAGARPRGARRGAARSARSGRS